MIVDIQNLNAVPQTHQVAPPYLKAKLLPGDIFKTVADVWEGYYSVPLVEDSSNLTQFITSFGCYHYLTNPQGNHVSGDAYNKCFKQGD